MLGQKKTELTKYLSTSRRQNRCLCNLLSVSALKLLLEWMIYIFDSTLRLLSRVQGNYYANENYLIGFSVIPFHFDFQVIGGVDVGMKQMIVG